MKKVKKILAFEGEPELAKSLRAGFWRYGCEVSVVDDEELGLQEAMESKPDLILLSIELPKTNGFSICNKLKRNRSLKEIPLVITSSECSDETFTSHRKMQTAAEDYLHKPFEFDELIGKVKKLITLDGPIQNGPPPECYEFIDEALEEMQDDEATQLQARSPFAESNSPPPKPLLTPVPRRPVTPAPSGSILTQKMIVLWSPDAQLRGQCFTFGDDDHRLLSFGRESDNTIVVNDPAVSKNHLMIERVKKGLAVRDLGSGGGTFVNNELVSFYELKGGEVLRLGDTTMLYLRGLDVDSQLERVIRELSERDPLARIYSYRRIREKLEEQLETARQEMTTLSLAAVSVDDLTRIAYRYGDLIAQRVVEEMASTLKSSASGAHVGRDFGPGFIVTIPGRSAKVALGMAEGWRFEASVSEIIVGKHAVATTLSIGVLEWREEWSATDLLRRAYKLLYEAQVAGGNQVAART